MPLLFLVSRGVFGCDEVFCATRVLRFVDFLLSLFLEHKSDRETQYILATIECEFFCIDMWLVVNGESF